MSLTTIVSSRNSYFDFLRGLAICMVVAIHTGPTYSFEGSLWSTLEVFTRLTLNVAVPTFLAISGFFLAKKSLYTTTERLSFWKKQIPKVYIPCLIWSLPLFALSIYNSTLNNLPIQIFKLLFCGFSVYYFVALIIQYYLLLPWLQPFKIKIVVIAGIMSTISILSITYLTKILDIGSLPLIVYAGPFPIWIVFFVMGGILRRVSRNYKLTVPLCLFLISFVLQYFEGLYISKLGGSGVGMKLSSFIYSAAFILIIFSKKLETKYNPYKRLNNIIEKIGNISFGIYLIHCYFIILFNKVIPYHYWVTDFLLVLLFTSIPILIARRIAPSFSKKYLGF